MTKTQQDVVIYKQKAFSTAQRLFEADLKKHQIDGWRLVSVTPTKKIGFGQIAELTVIYEKEVADDGRIVATSLFQEKAQEAAHITEQKAKAKARRWEQAQIARRLDKEREEAYRASLSPEELEQFLKNKRRKRIFTVLAIIIGVLVLWVVAYASDPSSFTSLSTPLPTDTPVPPTPTPTPINLVTQDGVEGYTKFVINNMGATRYGQLDSVMYTTSAQELEVTLYISSDQIWDNNHLKNMIKINCYDVEHAIWTSKLQSVIAVAVIHIQSDLVDKYNHTSKGDVGKVTLKAETAKLFNWDDDAFEQTWDNQAYDDQWMLPSLNS